MLSLRLASRTTRAVPRLSAAVARSSTAVVATRAGIANYTPAFSAASSNVAYLPRLTSSFSTSAFRQQPSGEADAELSAKLESELQFEDEMAKEEKAPASVQDYLSSSPFELIDTAGNQEVKMVRKMGEEKITIAFSVSEVPYEDQYPQEEEDAFDDAEEGGNNKPKESEGGEEGEDGMADRAPAVNFSVTIEKPGKTESVLAVECTAQDGEVVVEYVNQYESAAEAFASTPDASHARVERYTGPSFATLDEDLQVMVENYLDERGVTQALAVFLPDYVEFKEQREYMRWLKRVKSFIDA